MEIITFTSDYMDSHSYLMIEDSHAIVIDPSNCSVINEFVSCYPLIIDMCILTHEHCDHTYEAEQLKDRYNCPIVASKKCAERLPDPQKNFSAYYSAMIQICDVENYTRNACIEPFSATVDSVISDCSELVWNNHLLFFKETPGHSSASICILVDDEVLFSGDSLFSHKMVTLRFPSGSKKQYENITIPWLKTLPNDVIVYPGHYERFRLGTRLLYPLI